MGEDYSSYAFGASVAGEVCGSRSEKRSEESGRDGIGWMLILGHL